MKCPICNPNNLDRRKAAKVELAVQILYSYGMENEAEKLKALASGTIDTVLTLMVEPGEDMSSIPSFSDPECVCPEQPKVPRMVRIRTTCPVHAVEKITKEDRQ